MNESQIDEIQFTDSEKIVAGFFCGSGNEGVIKHGISKPGSFFSALIEAICIADENNRGKLHKGFPGIVVAVSSFQHGTYSVFKEEESKPSFIDRLVSEEMVD